MSMETTKTKTSHANPIEVVTLTMHTNQTLSNNLGKIEGSKNAIQFFKGMLANKDQEVFALLCINSKGTVTHYSEVHCGSINTSVVHPREVFKRAMLSNASSIIIGHNHPSGDTTPSKSDLKITGTLVESGNILDIHVLDHIIVSETGGQSLRETHGGHFE